MILYTKNETLINYTYSDNLYIFEKKKKKKKTKQKYIELYISLTIELCNDDTLDVHVSRQITSYPWRREVMMVNARFSLWIASRFPLEILSLLLICFIGSAQNEWTNLKARQHNLIP